MHAVLTSGYEVKLYVFWDFYYMCKVLDVYNQFSILSDKAWGQNFLVGYHYCYHNVC